MCMITHWQKPRTAKRNITCYKMLYDYDSKILRSIIANFEYIPYREYICKDPFKAYFNNYGNISAWDGKTREVYGISQNKPIHIDDLEIMNLTAISTGFHSFETLGRAIHSGFNRTWSFYKCTIRKGSLYYKSKDNLIVSDKIIINHKIDKYGKEER